MQYRTITLGDVAGQFLVILRAKARIVLGAVLGLAVINLLGNTIGSGGSGVVALLIQVMIQCVVTGQLLADGDPAAPLRRNGVLIGVTVLSSVAIFLGFVLLLVPGLLLMARWFLVAPIVLRHELKAVAAMRASWHATRPSQGTFLLLSVLYVVALAGALGLGIGAARWSGLAATSLVVSIPANLIADVVVVAGWLAAVAALQVVEVSEARLRNVFS